VPPKFAANVTTRRWERQAWGAIWKAMDITADMQLPTIEWTPVAQTMMEQLSADEQAKIQSSIDQIARGVDPGRVTQVNRSQPGQPPFYVLRATLELRVFFERAGDRVRILDVVGAEQWAFFRDETAFIAN
jgi:hypothetical protein